MWVITTRFIKESLNKSNNFRLVKKYGGRIKTQPPHSIFRVFALTSMPLIARLSPASLHDQVGIVLEYLWLWSAIEAEEMLQVRDLRVDGEYAELYNGSVHKSVSFH